MFLRRLIEWNVAASKRFDQLLPDDLSVDGNDDFRRNLVKEYLRPSMTIVDVGGGKRPFVDAETKRQLGLKIIGLDISEAELMSAPKGLYDEIVAADITTYRGQGNADLVICQAVLEHVKDNDLSFRSIASILGKNGTACIFVPSRNALFARLNLILPQRIKEAILFTVFPRSRHAQGFPSFYHKCTPASFRHLAEHNGLRVIETREYFVSSYFSFFLPLYIAWRLWILLFRHLLKSEAAETFSIVVRKALP